MADLTIETSSMICAMPTEFHQKKTSFFYFDEDAQVPLRKLIESRLGMEKPWKVSNKKIVQLPLTGRNDGMHFADLVVTDTPHEIYGYLERQFVMRTFKLEEINDRAFSILNINLDGWPHFWTLDVDQRSKLLGELVMRECNRQRKNEEDFLGIQKMSWEEFGRNFTTIDDDLHVYAFPNKKHLAFTFVSHFKNNLEHLGGLIYGDHLKDGTEKIWVLNTADLTNYFDFGSEVKPKIIPTDQWYDLANSLHGITAYATRIEVGYPNITTWNIPFIFDNILSIAQKYPRETFDLPTLTSLARQLQIKGYSGKTKAELSIMVGEAVANLPPTDTKASLVLDGLKPNKLKNQEEINKLARELTIKDYFMFHSRMVSNIAYSPHLTAHAAGRIPTDGSFNETITYEPIDIFSEV
jgi:hypothetical protein